MAEEKKDFPWIQLIATVGTIVAALIGITPYILKLNTPAAQTPTIVIVTLPPAVTTPAPVMTQPVTSAETSPVATQTIAVTTTPAATTLPPGPTIQITVNATSVPQGGFISASVSTDPAVPQVIITLRNSTTFESQPLTQALTQGNVTLSLDTSPYAPGDYAIYAAIPDTQAVASASFVITPVATPVPTTAATTTPTTTATTVPTTAATTVPTTA